MLIRYLGTGIGHKGQVDAEITDSEDEDGSDTMGDDLDDTANALGLDPLQNLGADHSDIRRTNGSNAEDGDDDVNENYGDDEGLNEDDDEDDIGYDGL